MNTTTRWTPRTKLAITAFMVCAVFVASCGDDNSSQSDAPAAGSPAAAGASASVVIKDVKFVTTEVRVAPNGTVTFDNQDTQPHTATADPRAPAPFDTDSIAAGARALITFAKVGTYTYHCSFHPFMTATVIVQ